MNIISTFDGISNLAYALVQMGHTNFNYYAFEIDKNAISIARYNAKKYNYNYILMGGVENCTEEWVKSLEGGVQVYCGGSPCTSLSIACASSGKRSDGKSGVITGSSALFYEWLRIRDLILKYNPKCPWILENVKSATKECVDIISNLTGVQPVYLDGKMFSAQRRARLFWSNVSFQAPKETEWDTTILRDVLLDTVDAKYYLSEEQQKKIKWLKRAKDGIKDGIKEGTKHGPMPFPTPLDKKTSTILTTQGVNRTTPVVECKRIGVIQTEYNSKEGSSPSQGSRICSDEGKTTTIPAMERGHDYFKVSDKHPCVTTALGRQGSSKEFLSSCKAIKEAIDKPKHQQDIVGTPDEKMRTICAGVHGSGPHLTKTITSSGIRRLTPIEVERLFNLPKDYTKYGIDDKGNLKEMKDGPRYKALGNSFLWKKIAWILKHRNDK